MTSPVLPESYTEHAPPASLREYVECFWTRVAPRLPNGRALVLPDGSIDLVLGYRSGADRSPTVALAVGTMTRALVLDETDSKAWVGVRFWPGRALPVLGVPASELTDLRLDIGDLWPGREAMLESLHGSDVVAVLGAYQRLLVGRLHNAMPLDQTVDAAIRAILRAGGNLSITSLAPALGVTRQHLARQFALHVGVPPKMFARVARVRRAVAKARVAAHVDWAALALETGYYDQSHLAGEIRELTSRAPTDWVTSI